MNARWREWRERVAALVRKEFRQLFRDPRMARIVFVSPLIQLMVFGYAVSTDLHGAATLVVDLDATAASRAVTEALHASGHFTVVARSHRPADLTAAMDRGDVVAGVEIPRGYAADLARGQATVQVIVDGTNSNTATLALSYAEQILQRHGARVASAGGAPLDLRERAWYNPDLASRDYNVPAVIGTIITLVCLVLTALAVVRERELGTLEQLRVSPLRAGELILGKTIPFGLIGLADLLVVTTVAVAWFGIPLRGSLPLLLLASVLFLLSALGVGLLISTFAATQQEAFMVSFLVFMPTMLLSGFMFPVSSMPVLVQRLTWLNPLRHYLEIIRGVFLKGAGVETLAVPLLALLAMGVGLLTLATWRFRRTG